MGLEPRVEVRDISLSLVQGVVGAMIGRFVSMGIVLIASLLLAGCYRDFGPVVAEPEPPPPPLVVTFIQTGDRLTVTVYNEPLLTGVYDVTPAGTIVMPLIGSVRAVGRTPSELGRIIAARYSRGKFLQEPQVTVAVVEYRPVYLFGEVAKPGTIPYRPGLNALTAVTDAGGLTYRGSKDTVLIQHAGEQVWNEYPLLSSVEILPGDIIRVPERFF
jgi:polysaccharide export outer membrane protein